MKYTARLRNTDPAMPPDPTRFVCIGHDRHVVTAWAKTTLVAAAPTEFVEISESVEQLVSVLTRRPVVTVKKDEKTGEEVEEISYETVETSAGPGRHERVDAARLATAGVSGTAGVDAQIAQLGDGSAIDVERGGR